MTFEEIKELIGVLDNSSLASIKIQKDDFYINLSKNGGKITQVAAPAAAPKTTIQQPQAIQTEEAPAPVASKSGGEIITSPMVGTFYKSPSPDSPAFVKVGDTVKEGQALAIIEAMKIMNELEAEFSCKILEILVKDGQVIEYDTPLFRVEKV